MATERVRRMEAVFGQALELAPGERTAFLDEACGDDLEMRRDIASLLDADTAAPGFLEQPVVQRGPTHPHAEAATHKRVGHYELLRRIGTGGMSEVYLAVRADDAYQKRVAVKVIRQDLDREDMLRRFRTERQILAGLDHPNIAKLLDGGTTDEGRPYFVMDYIDGVSIDTYCDDHRLTIRERLELFRTVCSAVQYAHQNLVVHRDIKANNIMVTVDGVPKLLDFGIAKLLKPDHFAQQVEYTVTWMRPMTPRYASPEQIQGRPVTTTSDVYSLGVLLYKLLSGHLPYRMDGQPVTELGRLIVEQEPERPSTAVTRIEPVPANEPASSGETTPHSVSLARNTQPQHLRRQLAGDLDNIVLMAIRKEPQRRYATVEQMSEDIRRYQAGLPVIARTDTLGYRTTKFVRRNWLPVGGVGAFLLLLVVFAIGMTLQAARIKQQRDEARRERDRAERVTTFLQEIFEVSDPTSSEDITAREILERGAERVAVELADEPQDQATMMQVIGNVYRGLGLYDRARPLLEKTLDTRREMLGPDHPLVAQSLDSLGFLEGLMGEFELSQAHLQTALDMRRQWIAEDPMGIVESLNQLGVLSRLMGKFDVAETYYREALTIQEQSFGETDELADSINNLGAVLLRTGRMDEAEAQFRAALAIRRRVLGPDHPAMGKILSNLGVALGMQGRYEESEVVLRETVRVYREGLGDDHPWLIEGLNNLGKLLQRKGDPDGAEALYREALDIQRRRLGDDHPLLAHLMSNLAELLRDKQDYAAAEQFSRDALALRRRLFGDQHPDVGGSLVGLALLLRDTGRSAEAEALLLEARDVLAATLPEAHWQHDQVRSSLAACLIELERYEEAEPLAVAGFEGLRDKRGAGHRLTRAALENVIQLYEAMGRPDDAATYRALLDAP